MQQQHCTISSASLSRTAAGTERATNSSHMRPALASPQMCKGGCSVPSRARRWALLVLLLISLLASAAAIGTTAQPDVDALVGFMAAFPRVGGTVLADWDVFVDPCLGGWPGVICTCEDLPRALAASCRSSSSSSVNASTEAASSLRVRGLELGPLMTADGQKLAGTISPAVGSLSELVYLDLSDNMLR